MKMIINNASMGQIKHMIAIGEMKGRCIPTASLYYYTTKNAEIQDLYRPLPRVIVHSYKGGKVMGEQNWLELLNGQTWLKQVRAANQYTEQFGLTLSETDTELLLEEKNNTLKAEQRVEFGQSILPQMIYAFCDSSFLSQNNYVETLIRLQEMFYLYKNEMQDEITDDELLHFMKEQFETVCCGDLDYLEGTCLDIFAQAIRAGYRGYQKTQGYGEFEKFDIVPRWDKELYLETLRELCWR